MPGDTVERGESLAAGNLGERIAAYGAWRGDLADALRRYASWLEGADLGDQSVRSRIDRLVARLREDRLSIAFVAEFSRGKSELINALFFADYGQRIVPSTAGRTTMCPTELLYDPAYASSIRLLPIESRLTDATVAELRGDASAWHEIAINPGDAESVARAFASVRETRRALIEQAAELGLYADGDPDSPVHPDADGTVEIPRWRHAIVNIPDPLLQTGLVVIDTPGLNAIGSEPELTLNLIPSADAVLFVLAADAGVTRTDIDVWREHICPAHDSGRFVVLNKIDGLWDELRDEDQIDEEIDQQVASASRMLDLDPERVFPVSAQKGLVAKIQSDPALLARSRLPALERALSTELVPRQQALVRERIGREFEDLASATSALLNARRRAIVEQLFELNGLRGKNRSVVDLMAARVKGERSDFEKSLRHLQALRIVVSRHSQSIYTTIGVEALKKHVRGAREQMRASNFSVGLRDGMSALVSASRADFDQVGRVLDEVTTLMSAMYRTFSAEHGLTLGVPMGFSVRRYLEELDRVEALQRRQFGALSLVTTEKWALMRRFFESVAARIREIYDLANREIETWLRAVIAPIEGQVREHQSQLRRRLDSVRRVLDATQSLDSRIAEIDEARALIEQQIAIVSELADQARTLLAHTIEGVDETAYEPA